MVLNASYLYLAPQLPPASQLQDVSFQIPLRIFSADQQLIGEFGDKRRTPLGFADFPPAFVQAVLAAEDERFFRHNGVDLRGLARAALELLRYQEIRSGGSTITMQVARNFFLGRDQKFLRKFNEIVLALEIESVLSKEQIFSLYMNKIFLGHRAYGAEAAAQVYYGKPLAELSLPQWAMLAGLPKAPSAYNPITNAQRARSRRDWILGRMYSIGMIDQAIWRASIAEPVTARYHGPSIDVDAQYFAEQIRRQLLQRFDADQVYATGMRVYTTLHTDRQRAAVAALRQGLHEYDERHGWRGPEAQVAAPALPPLPPVPTEAGGEASASTGASTTEAASEEELAATAAARDALDQWLAALADFEEIAGTLPALVTAVEQQQAQLLLKDGSRRQLDWPQMNWARPYIDNNTVGAEPSEAADILAAGDIVRLRPLPGEDGTTIWRLAQIPQVQSALASLDPETGNVQALVGGYDFSLSNYNRAVQGKRQAGSAFKPFIYTAALANGLTTASLINDAPIVFEDDALETVWRPTGAGSRFYGPTRLREALYRSLNLVSIRLLRQIGLNAATETLKRFALPVERFQRDLSLALGSASLTPLELASTYSVFANGGHVVTPNWITRIEGNNGQLLWQAPAVILCDSDCKAERATPAEQQQQAEPSAAQQESAADTVNDTQASATDIDKTAVPQTTGNGASAGDLSSADDPEPPQPASIYLPRQLDARHIWLMDSILRDVVRRGTAYRARQLGRTDLAGKTGTTNEQFDAWFAGYSPALVSTVWVGFDDPATLGRGEYGGRAALPIWMQYMGAALANTEEIVRPQPAGIVTARINSETGKLARPGESDAIFEYFLEGTIPEMEPLHRSRNEDEEYSSPDHLF